MKALEGVWNVASLEVDGSKMPPGMFGGSRIILMGDTFTTDSMGATYQGTYTIDGKRTPHTIDITFTDGPHAGRRSFGIFTLDGDRWNLCLGMAGRQRPRDFVTTPGSGHALETLTRSRALREKVRGKKGKPPTRKVARARGPAAGGIPAAPSASLAEHSGEWSMVSLDQSGQQGVPPAYLRYGRRLVRGNELTVTMNGQVMLKATFEVDPSTKPRSIDYTISAGPLAGKKQRGIYELEGKKARYCMAPPGARRPPEFLTKPGDGRTLSVWKKTT